MVVESLVRSEALEDKECEYSYNLVKNEVSLSLGDDTMEVQAYGVEILRQDIVDGILINTVSDSIKCISPQRHKVHSLLKLLYDNSVSPIHLVDILGDYVDDYISDFDKVLVHAVQL